MIKDDIKKMIEPLLNKTFLFYLYEDNEYQEYIVSIVLVEEDEDLILQVLSKDNKILDSAHLIKSSKIFYKISISRSLILINDTISLTLQN